MVKPKDKRFYLFERANAASDGSGYSFFIDGLLLDKAQKVTFTFLKRGKNHKREDLGRFFLDYRSFSAVLSVISNRLRSKGKLATYEESFYGGLDGKRRLQFTLKDAIIFINVYDNLIQNEMEDCKGYSGKLMFSIKKALDMQELFDLRRMLSNWESTRIDKLVNHDPKTTTTKE